MFEVKNVATSKEKLYVVEKLVKNLPNWFGENTTIEDVVESVGDFENVPFFVACYEHGAAGFIFLKIHNPTTAEIGMMAVLGTQHGKGIGRKLIEHCEAYCRDNKIEYLSVKTIDESSDNDSYKGTRAFYRALGFKPLEVLPNFWGEGLPCLFSIKCITP